MVNIYKKIMSSVQCAPIMSALDVDSAPKEWEDAQKSYNDKIKIQKIASHKFFESGKLFQVFFGQGRDKHGVFFQIIVFHLFELLLVLFVHRLFEIVPFFQQFFVAVIFLGAFFFHK